MTESETDTYSHLKMDEIRVPTLADTVADTLRTSILAGKFSGGERLYEAALAREFGISRGPIREALVLLEGDGLVENIPRRGKFITQLDSQTIDEIYSLRRVLEPYAVELVIDRMSHEIEAALSLALAELDAAIASGDAVAVAEHDIAFHALVYGLSGHGKLKRTWDDIISSKLIMLVNLTTRTHDIAGPSENHQLIVDTIMTRHVERSRALIVEHIDDAWKRAKVALQDVLSATSKSEDLSTGRAAAGSGDG